MFGFMRTLMMCTMAGMLLSLVFLTPAGAVVGAVHGFLIGVCVGVGEWKATHAKVSCIQQSI